jgi:hypothetical protein
MIMNGKYLSVFKPIIRIPYVIEILYFPNDKWKKVSKFHQIYLQIYIFTLGKIEIRIPDVNFILGI